MFFMLKCSMRLVSWVVSYSLMDFYDRTVFLLERVRGIRRRWRQVHLLRPLFRVHFPKFGTYQPPWKQKTKKWNIRLCHWKQIAAIIKSSRKTPNELGLVVNLLLQYSWLNHNRQSVYRQIKWDSDKGFHGSNRNWMIQAEWVLYEL